MHSFFYQEKYNCEFDHFDHLENFCQTFGIEKVFKLCLLNTLLI